MASTKTTASLLLFATVLLHLSAASNAIGINYGTNGNLPPPDAVANFLKTKTSIDSVKIFDTNPDILRAFANSGISVTVTVPNGDIPNLVKVRQARKWVSQTIKPFYQQTKIKYVIVGNEVLLGNDNNLISNLVPAIRSIQRALIKEKINDTKVTTSHALNIIDYNTFGPPSVAKFRPGWDKEVLAPNLYYLRKAKAPFMITPYPYFGFGYDPANANFALFKPNNGVFDPFTKIMYTNMFDSVMDATYSAMKALGYGDVEIVIGETGWPSACDAEYCSPDNAAGYNREVIRRVSGQGTPLMPNRRFETYIFALFNEELKPGPTAERNWGLFQPDFTPVYDVGLLRTAK